MMISIYFMILGLTNICQCDDDKWKEVSINFLKSDSNIWKRYKREGFFLDLNIPMLSVRQGVQDLHSRLGRSMHSLLTMGSSISKRMLGQVSRSPRFVPHQLSGDILPLPYIKQTQQALTQVDPLLLDNQVNNHISTLPHLTIPDRVTTNRFSYQPLSSNKGRDEQVFHSNPVLHPDFKDCKCKFGLDDKITHFLPIDSAKEEILSSVQPFQSEAIIQDNSVEDPAVSIHFSNHLMKDQTQEPLPDISTVPVSHPGGSADIDIHKVEVLGAASVVQEASASVPDQKHPEKYMNFDSDTLEDVVNNNLWYKDTTLLKLHLKGNRGKVKVHNML